MIEQACQLGKTNSHEAQGLLHKNSREIVTILKGAVRPITNGSWGYPLFCGERLTVTVTALLQKWRARYY